MRACCSMCPPGGVSLLNTLPKPNPSNHCLSASCTLRKAPRPRPRCCNGKRDTHHVLHAGKCIGRGASINIRDSCDKLKENNTWVASFARRDWLASGGLCSMAENYHNVSPLRLVVGTGYWVQGFRCFPWLAVSFYLKDNLRVDAGTLQFLQNTVNLPMVAKPIYGIISDAVYIGGAHRVPYIVIGGLLQVISWGSIAVIPAARSTVFVMMAFLLLSNLGASIVEVANDALVAECAKKDKASSSGKLQSYAWMASAAGGVMGNLFGGIAISQVDTRNMFLIFSSLLGIQVGTSLTLSEKSFGLAGVKEIKGADHPSQIERKAQDSPSSHRSSANAFVHNVICWGWMKGSTVKSVAKQISDLVRVVRKPEIAYPLTWFAASYAMIPILTGTMFFYHTQHLKIDPTVVGLAKVIGQMGLLLGSFIYNRFLTKAPLRKLLCSVQILLSVCMLSDILLVKQLNIQLGIPNEVYILGASALVEAIAQFKILPFAVLLAQLCPAGCEGSLMAFFMSAQCLASIVSGYLGIALASFIGVSSDNYSGLPLGIFIQAMAALVPLIWISFIPDTKPANEHCKMPSKVL